jgi:hypothetical protein
MAQFFKPQNYRQLKKFFLHFLFFDNKNKPNFAALKKDVAGVVKLVDTPDLGSGAARCEGSSPFARTIFKSSK